MEAQNEAWVVGEEPEILTGFFYRKLVGPIKSGLFLAFYYGVTKPRMARRDESGLGSCGRVGSTEMKYLWMVFRLYGNKHVACPKKRL